MLSAVSGMINPEVKRLNCQPRSQENWNLRGCRLGFFSSHRTRTLWESTQAFRYIGKHQHTGAMRQCTPGSFTPSPPLPPSLALLLNMHATA